MDRFVRQKHKGNEKSATDDLTNVFGPLFYDHNLGISFTFLVLNSLLFHPYFSNVI